jgi:hypothetical protein
MMVAVIPLVEYEDPLTAAARTSGDTMTPHKAAYDELRVIADRRLGELEYAVAAPTDRRRASRRSGWRRCRAAMSRRRDDSDGVR